MGCIVMCLPACAKVRYTLRVYLTLAHAVRRYGTNVNLFSAAFT